MSVRDDLHYIKSSDNISEDGVRKQSSMDQVPEVIVTIDRARVQQLRDSSLYDQLLH